MPMIDVGCDLQYEVFAPTSFLFQVAVVKDSYQGVVSESLTFSPEMPVAACEVGLMGNRMHRLVAQPGGVINLAYRARVNLDASLASTDALHEVPHSEIPAEILPFLNPSRYCESDRLLKLARDEFGGVTPGHSRVSYVVDWVHNRLSYVPGSTGPSTTACDVLLQREGVCRDYAHVAISLCRALGIPTRYVAGYAVDLDPPDFHGFFEAWLGDDWYLFDATRLAPVSGFVRIGAGRDAADVSFATRIGNATEGQMSVWAHLVEAGDKGRPANAQGVAVSTS